MSSERVKMLPTTSKERRENSPSEPEPKRKKKPEATGSLRHQIAPLDSIMEEMEKEVQRKKEIAAAAAAEAAAIAQESEPSIEICRLTRDALENMPMDNTMVADFVNRDCIMYQLLGHKMMEGRLQAYPNLGYVKSDSAIFPPFAYEKVGPRTPPMEEPPPSAPRKGPKTPPGSPGPRTPPSLPPQEDEKTNLANVAAFTGSNVSQLQAYFGSELSEAIGSMGKTTFLEKIKDAIISSVSKKKDDKPSPTRPEPPRRSRDNVSVKMELVSDGSLSPEKPPSPVVAPPPPPPIIEPPPRPPSFTTSKLDTSVPPWPVKEEKETLLRQPSFMPTAVPVPPHPFMQPPPPMMPPPPMPMFPPPTGGPIPVPPPNVPPPPQQNIMPPVGTPPTIMVKKITIPQQQNNMPKLDVKITPLRPCDIKPEIKNRVSEHTSSAEMNGIISSTPGHLTPFKNNKMPNPSTPLTGANGSHRGSLQNSTPTSGFNSIKPPTPSNSTRSAEDKPVPTISNQTVTNALLSALGIGGKAAESPRTQPTETRPPYPSANLHDFASQPWSHEASSPQPPPKMNHEYTPNTPPVNGHHHAHSGPISGRALHRGHGMPRNPMSRPPLHKGPPRGGNSALGVRHHVPPIGPPHSLPPHPTFNRGMPNLRFRGGQRRNGGGGRPLRHT